MGFLAALPALGAIGAGVSAVGTVLGGVAQANQASYQAQIANNNAKVAAQNADHAMEAGEAQAQQQSMKGAAQEGLIEASEAANGVDVNSGSALDVQVSQREANKLDANNVLNNAELTAYGYRSQQQSDLAQSKLDENEAAEAPIGAAIGATGSFLSNAQSLSPKWSGLQPQGMY